MANEMTNKQKVEHTIKRMIERRISPYNLGMRAKIGLSSASAYQTKLCVNMIKDMSKSDVDSLLGVEEYNPYMRMFISFADELKKKEMNKNIDKSEKFSKIISDIKNEIDPIIKEQQEKIKKSIIKSWENINKEYEEIGESNFKQKYGTKRYRAGGTYYISMTDFSMSFLGSLLKKSEKYLMIDIEGRQKAYKDKEYAKINRLITNLYERYNDIDNIKLINTNRSVNGIEFTMTANVNDTNLIINTTTIYAGGYNIQRLHLRWLMNVIDRKTGRTVYSIKGDN
jgi:hypothetical protein